MDRAYWFPASLQPVLDSEPGDWLKILIGSEKSQLVLAGHRCDEQVELRQHPATGTKLAKNVCELGCRILVGRPLAEDTKSGLKTGQVLPVAAADPDTGPTLAVDGQADAKTVPAAQRRINPWLEYGVAVEIS